MNTKKISPPRSLRPLTVGNNRIMTELTSTASAQTILQTMASLTPEQAQDAVSQLQAVLDALPDSDGSVPLRTALEAFVIGYNAGRRAATGH